MKNILKILALYKTTIQKRPLITASMTSATLAVTSDYICQIFIEKSRNKLNFTRSPVNFYKPNYSRSLKMCLLAAC